jgi:endoribonuclease L-PSP, putative
MPIKTPVATDKAPAAIGPYSQAISIGNLLYTAGQVPLIPGTKDMPEGITMQTTQSLNNVKAILEAAGSGMEKVIKTTVFLADMKDFAAFNEVYATFFTEPYPARSCVAVKALPLGALVEVEAVALL